jgi:hypothetical protein
MSSNVSGQELSELLERTSRKFARICDQIRAIKRRIAELTGLYAYYENISVEEEEEGDEDEEEEVTTAEANNHEHSKHTSSSSSSSGELVKEHVRREIESLQSVKSVYLAYAYKKADEITRLQCDLYGEDMVREAYQQQADDAQPSNNQQTNENAAQFVDYAAVTTGDSRLINESQHETNTNVVNNSSDELNEYDANSHNDNNNNNDNDGYNVISEISYFHIFDNHEQQSFYFNSN